MKAFIPVVMACLALAGGALANDLDSDDCQPKDNSIAKLRDAGNGDLRHVPYAHRKEGCGDKKHDVYYYYAPAVPYPMPNNMNQPRGNEAGTAPSNPNPMGAGR
ncbi:MAG TPA: hypothetical protein VFT64_06795 [Rickettsiales bacterium]|nr:hypothetical protein [Rickettsiales bacterium]